MGRKPAKLLTKYCELCNKEFTYKDLIINKNRRFCSGVCAKTFNGSKNKGRTHTEEINKRKGLPGKKNPFYGRSHSDETKKKISSNKKGTPCPAHIKQMFSEKYRGEGNPFYGKKHSKETISKLISLANTPEGKAIRRKNITNLNKKQFIPNYNPEACKLFEEINKTFGWNGIHAENGGEFYIEELGYWVDYYEPNENIVIEFDEKAHDSIRKKRKDIDRQKKIINTLQCKFYRIKEEEKTEWQRKVQSS
jgi:hypothetical protein